VWTRYEFIIMLRDVTLLPNMMMMMLILLGGVSFFSFPGLVNGFSTRLSLLKPTPNTLGAQLSPLQACPMRRARLGEPWILHDRREHNMKEDMQDITTHNTTHKTTHNNSTGNKTNTCENLHLAYNISHPPLLDYTNQSEYAEQAKHAIKVYSSNTPAPSPPRAFSASARGQQREMQALVQHMMQHNMQEQHELQELQESVVALKNQVHYLYEIVRELCSSIVRCDDMALLERELLHHGRIWTSNAHRESFLDRAPRTLRGDVLNMTNRMHMPLNTPGDGVI